MAGPTDAATISVRCSGNAPAGLLAKTKVNIVALTATNFTAQVAAVNALSTAENALTTGVIANTGIEQTLGCSATYPTAIANRGQKWIITASNANGRKFTYTIPAALETGQVQSDNYTADLTTTEWAAFKTAFQAVAKDPAANALTLDSAKLGGRRR